MSKSPKRKTLHVIAKYFYQSTNDVQAHIVKTYNAFDPEEWNITIHSTTDTLTHKDTLRKREMIGEIQVRRSRSNFFGFSPKIQWDKTDLICLYGFKLFPHIFVFLKTLYLKISGQKKYALMFIPQGGFVPYWKRYSYLRRIGKKIYHALIGRMLINLTSDGILTISNWERHEMIKKGLREELIVTIPDGIDDEAFEDVSLKASDQIKQRAAKYGAYILQLGRLQPLKNYETTIKSLSFLPDTVNLVIAGPIGDKKYMKKLQHLVKKYHIERRVFFHGIIRSYDKYFLMRNARLLVHIPLWDANGTVIYEAMSQGLIGIVSNQSAPIGIIHDEVNGYLINPTDDLELGKKIYHILNAKNTSKLKHMISRNLNMVQELKSSRLQKRLEIFYTTILMKQKYPYRLSSSHAL